IWYLGLHDALRDATGTFGAKSVVTVSAFSRLQETFYTLMGILNALSGTWWIFLIALLMLAFHYWLVTKDTSNHGFPPFRAVLLFAAAGLPFIVVLPKAAEMFYEPRQLLPLAAI